jgi:hypothetical protein
MGYSTMNRAEELEGAFCDMLDEQGDVVICGITFSRSAILKDMDPIAYDTELANFFDAQGFDIDAEEEEDSEYDGQPDEHTEWMDFDPDC